MLGKLEQELVGLAAEADVRVAGVGHRREAGRPDLQHAKQGQEVPLHEPGRVFETDSRHRRHRRTDRDQQPEGARADGAVVGLFQQVEQRVDRVSPEAAHQAFDRGEVEARHGELEPETRGRGDVVPQRVRRGGAGRRRLAEHADRLGNPARFDERLQGRVDPGTATVGLEPDLEHQRRLAVEPVLLHHARVAGRLAHHAVEDRGVLAGVGVLEIPLGDQLRHVPPQHRLRLGAAALGPLLGVMGELVQQPEELVRDGLAGGGRRGLDDFDHGVDRKHLGRGEREAAPLGVVGSGLEHAPERLGLERRDQAGHPLAHAGLPGPLAPGHLVGDLAEIVQHDAIVPDLLRLRIDRPGDDQRIFRGVGGAAVGGQREMGQARARALRPASRARRPSSSSCRNRRFSSGGWTLRWIQAPPAPSRRPNGPSSPCGSAARAPRRSSISWSEMPRSKRSVAMRWRWSRRARSLRRAFRGSVATPATISWCRATPIASVSRGARRDSSRLTKRSVDSWRWGWPRGYIARLCSTMENSTRKSAKSLDRVAVERAPGVWERGGSPSGIELMVGGR